MANHESLGLLGKWLLGISSIACNGFAGYALWEHNNQAFLVALGVGLGTAIIVATGKRPAAKPTLSFIGTFVSALHAAFQGGGKGDT